MSGPLAKANYLVERVLQCAIGLSNTLPQTKHEALIEIGERYRFDIVTDTSIHDAQTCFDATTAEDQDRFAELLAAQLSLYSDEVIHCCGLRRLILSRNLTSKGKRLAGLAELGLWELPTIVYDAAIAYREGSDGRSTVHHELFHAMDYRDDLGHFADPDWWHLNEPGFRYNADLAFRDMPTFDYRDVELPEKGFLNTYSTQNPYEDKATLYGNLVTRYAFVMEKCRTDNILGRKVEHLKQLLKKFHPYFDDAFWEHIAQSC